MAGPRNRLLATPEFLDRLEGLRIDSVGGDRRAATTYAEVVRVVRRLGNGKECGHHPLTDRTGDGRGDLRDCTVSEFRSDPNGKIDCRLVWRQLAAQEPGSAPVAMPPPRLGQRARGMPTSGSVSDTLSGPADAA